VRRFILMSKIKTLINRIRNNHIIKKNRIFVGSGVRINGVISYHGTGNRLIIKEKTIINSGSEYIPIGYENRTSFWIVGNGKISIGEECGITNSSLVSFDEIHIGNHVLLGSGVKIYDSDFHSLDYLTRRDIDNDNDRKSEPVYLGDDVFVGAGTMVLKGSHIGDRSIIGAGSVVSGNVPSDEVWAGNPARFIRKLNS